MITPETILLFFLFQFVLYGLPLVILIYAIRQFRRDRQRGLLLIVLAIAPVAYYGYRIVTDRVLAPQLRIAQVAAWPRKMIPPGDPPGILVAQAWWVAKTLVGTGPFVKGYGMARDRWYAFQRTSNPGLPIAQRMAAISERARSAQTDSLCCGCGVGPAGPA